MKIIELLLLGCSAVMIGLMHFVTAQFRVFYSGDDQRWRRYFNIGVTVLVCGALAAIALYGAVIGDRIALQ